MPTPNKFQRWIDLMAALLVRQFPATFDELTTGVPEYAAKRREIDAATAPHVRRKLEDSLKRTFERDKQELKDFGIPLETLPDTDGNPSGAYRLRRTDFYLPYLCVAIPGESLPAVARVDKYGYQALATLTFEPDELSAIVESAALVRAIGDPLLAADASNALRKLAVDLPVDAAAMPVILPRARAGSAAFEALSDALHRRKSVTFGYHAFSDDQIEERSVEPYGLFFLSGHWYLVARDRALGALRNFRLNRIRDVAVNAKQPLSSDYDIPFTFRLRDHAASRQAWELGNEDIVPVVVEFAGTSGEALAAAKLGQPVSAHPTRRAFAVRRADPFVRWALSLAGEMSIVSPPRIAEQLRIEATATLALYQRDALPVDERSVQRAAPLPFNAGSTHWQPKGAAAQLQRVLQMIPQFADGEEHTFSELEQRTGADAATMQRDLESLVDRFDVPAGFVEGVRLFIESERVSVMSNHFLRPMRLTASELCALELGLTMLRTQRPPDDLGMLERARDRLRSVIAQLPSDPIPIGIHHASIGDAGNVEALGVMRSALESKHHVRMVYRRSGSDGPDTRVICPYALVASNGRLYVVAHCMRERGIRVFRMDRVQFAEALADVFERPSDFRVEDVLTDGRVFQGEAPETLVVRFSAAIARWIAEREGVKPDRDGSLVMAYPLADPSWAMRFVLQYGAQAEAVSPQSLRDAILQHLSHITSIR